LCGLFLDHSVYFLHNDLEILRKGMLIHCSAQGLYEDRSLNCVTRAFHTLGGAVALHIVRVIRFKSRRIRPNFFCSCFVLARLDYKNFGFALQGAIVAKWKQHIIIQVVRLTIARFDLLLTPAMAQDYDDQAGQLVKFCQSH